MHLFIPGALPPATVARELAAQLTQHAPTLYAWMRRLPATVEIVDPRETGCTAAEAWELHRSGFQPEPDQRLGAGLGPLRLGAHDHEKHFDEPIWIADLVHLAVGANHVTLTNPSQLTVSEDEDHALFEALAPWLGDTGFSLARSAPGRWRVVVPKGLTLSSTSPAAVSGAQLDDWWPQDAASRPWRRLLNEIQMLWYDHPVNAARAMQGLPTINGLWLYGGARPWSLPPPTHDATLIRTDLAAPAAVGDWSAWLTALAALDRTVLAPLATSGTPSRIVLAGDDRLVTLSPTRNLLPAWFPRRTQHWTNWWHPLP